MRRHAVSTDLLCDQAAYECQLKQIHEATVAGVPPPRPPRPPRPVIADSWHRSLAANVDPTHGAPPLVYDSATVREIRAAHPLASLLPLLQSSLLSITDETEHVMVVPDADGHILWRDGHRAQMRRADRDMLAEGFQWSETAIGTNGMGTALAVREPVQVHADEHLVSACHTWTCTAAPIIDPETAIVLGTVDISGPVHTVHPTILLLVSSAARLAESHLEIRLAWDDARMRDKYQGELEALRGEPGALLSPSGRVVDTHGIGRLPRRLDIIGSTVRMPDGRPALLETLPDGYLLRVPRSHRQSLGRPRLSLQFLNDGVPTASVDGHEVPLTPRHAEILASRAAPRRHHISEARTGVVRRRWARAHRSHRAAPAASESRGGCDIDGSLQDRRRA